VQTRITWFPEGQPWPVLSPETKSVLEDVLVYDGYRTPFLFRHYSSGSVDVFRSDGTLARYEEVKWVLDLVEGAVVTWTKLDQVFRQLERVTIVKRYPYGYLRSGGRYEEKPDFEPVEESVEDLPQDAWTLCLTGPAEGVT